MPYPPCNEPQTNYTEQPVTIVSKEETAQIWAGSLMMASGAWLSGAEPTFQSGIYNAASGYCYLSGDVDVSPISHSGWGHIRVRELSQVHAAIIVPKKPCIQATPEWMDGNCSGQVQSGIGGISGNVMLVHYCDTCPQYSYSLSGGLCWDSGTSMNSGIVDVFAFGSKY